MSTANENAIFFRGDGGRATSPRRSSSREVAHDVRQPLAAIGALLSSAERQPDVPAPVRRCLQQIRSQVDDLNRLCRRLVDRQERRWTRVAVHELAASAAEAAALASGQVIGVAAVDASVEGDEVDLRRALLNLLDNACRATGAAGTVAVRVRLAADGDVRIEVHDDGPGFGHVAPGTASLGLDIVDGVAADHGGHLEIAASDLGGAAVAMVLPAASPNRIGGLRRDASLTTVVWSDNTENSDNRGGGQCA